MARIVDREVLVGFIEEARSYLPGILNGIEDFSANPTDIVRLEEAHRYAHSIKGASAMVGLNHLSQLAHQLEEAFEEIAAGQIRMNENTAAALREVVRVVEACLDGALNDSTDYEALLGEADRIFHRLRGAEQEIVPPVMEEPHPAAMFNDFEHEMPFPSPEDAGFHETDEMPYVAETYSDEGTDTPASPFAAAPAAPDNGQRTTDNGHPDLSPELLEIFELEAEDHLRTISLALPALAQQPNNKELLQQIRRSAHSLKGAAAMVGFREITQLAHRMEDLLDLLYDNNLSLTPEMVSLLFSSTDMLEDLTGGRVEERALRSLYTEYDFLLGGHASQPISSLPDAQASEPVTEEEPGLESAEPLPALPEDFEISEEPSAIGGPSGLETAPLVFPDEDSESPIRATVPLQQGRKQSVRVAIDRLDDLVKVASEMVIARTAFEQSMADFARQLQELRSSTDRLKRVSSRLETEYEASTLGGGVSSPAASPLAFSVLSALPSSRLLTANTHGFDDLEFDRYTEFHLLSRELTETTTDVHTIERAFTNLFAEFESFLNRQSRLYSEIQEKLMNTRLVPLSMMAARLSRTVRTVAASQGKPVEFVLDGESTELDKTLYDEMADPLLHLLRNAVDHGIEAPEVRRSMGKAANGTISLQAFYEGNEVVIRVSDDGAGIDPEAIRAAAVRDGYLSAEDAANLSQEDLYAMVFLPGFSTKHQVSEVSGRGVGLDILKATVDKLKGSVTITSEVGQGTTFTIRLPLKLALTRALLVRANGESFAVPLSAVVQVLRLNSESVEQVGEEKMVRVGDNLYQLLSLGKLLNLPLPPEETDSRLPMLLMRVEDRQFAVTVDRILGGREIVIKSLGNHLRRVHGVMGATLMGDGSVVLILNPAELVRDALKPRAPQYAPASRPVAPAREVVNVIVVDDSPSVRRVISSLLQGSGYNVLQAKDGLDALEIMGRMPSPPDIMLLDIEMPRMDGYELLSTMRKQDAYRAVPVVMITSRAGEKHRQKAFELGATDYLVKPYQDETILSLIRRLTRAEVSQGVH
ncbi:MAG TPA: Hpt domain-containing protein [Blastocatellia bacterium]|nr:Hpt domain-containing protein [Blastocatellia bacterium]